MIQMQIDFTTVVHRRENNAASEANLERNRFHFTGQCAVIKSLLEKGIRLTTALALIEYHIGHLPRRIKDLKDAGFPVISREIDNRGTKEYYLNEP
jgi:hypothetical protein